MKLHYAEVLNPRKVCALAKYLGSPVSYVKVDLAKGAHLGPAFRKLNPNGKIPVLEDDGHVLWEADAILCHLARRAGSDLWPSDARQVEVMRWLSWNQAHFQRFAGVSYFERVIKPMFGAAPASEEKIAEATKPFRRAARVLDDHLADRPFLTGDTLSIADFSVAITLPYAEKAGLPLDDCPAILRWHDRLMQIDAWRDPWPTAAI